MYQNEMYKKYVIIIQCEVVPFGKRNQQGPITNSSAGDSALVYAWSAVFFSVELMSQCIR